METLTTGVAAGWGAAFLAVIAAVCGIFALIRFVSTQVRSHPDLQAAWRHREGSVVEKAWWLLPHLVRRELPRTRFSRLFERIEIHLTQAGRPANETAEDFVASAITEGIFLTFGLSALLWVTVGTPFLLLTAGVGLLHTFGLHPQLLRSAARQRVGKIQRQLPYAIDQMVLVLEAGGTLRESLALLAQDSEEDPLGQEVAQVLGRMAGGRSLNEALVDMSNRIRLEDLSSLVIAINRGEKTGAPMIRTLETQAEIFRFRRLQRAERLAVEAPVKMMFPNIIIMLAVLLLVLGPIFVKLIQTDVF